MSLVVFRHTLRQVRRTMGVLTVASGAFYYLVLLASSSFISNSPGFFRNPPKAIEAFLGGSADFLSPGGWLVAGMTHPITLALLSASALLVAASAVATELERGTIDLVLVRPVGRRPFLLAKAAASIVPVTAAEIGGFVGFLVARLTVNQIDEVDVGHVALAFFGSWVLFVSLSMVAILVSARSSLRGRAIGIAVGVIVAWYFMNFIALLIDAVSPMRAASPFHYFRPSELIKGQAVSDLLVLVGLGAVALLAGVAGFARRDLSR